MGGVVRFPVTLDGIRDTRQLRQRRLVLLASAGLTAIGLVVWLFGNPVGVVFVAIGVFLILEWRFPVFDAWFDRRRLVVGSVCEVWLDDTGIRWQQGRDGVFSTAGHVDWSQISGVVENDRVSLIMGGRAALVGIPKRHVESAELLASFLVELRRTIADRHGRSPQQ